MTTTRARKTGLGSRARTVTEASRRGRGARAQRTGGPKEYDGDAEGSMPKGFRIPLEPNLSYGLMFLIGGRLSTHLGQGILYGHQAESLLSIHLSRGILYSHQAESLFDL
ncbi:hypothetical protein BDV23DRAFT_178368 [Aspergillus alliaceus]|uniref:Uncharacterized protein n=1 Tax=Petromyces alliaceus TaxID=209559 RepID=A0A5N7CQ38_PETAA|nr:hypothetical protein BDV23DRAFT_178368 [Aspergillus alliaceus]